MTTRTELSFDDATTYEVEGNKFGADDINQTNSVVNTIMGAGVEVTYEESTVKITAPTGATMITFIAPSNFSASDKYTINGGSVTLTDLNGEPLHDAWKQGSPVTLTLNGNKAFFKAGGGGSKIPPDLAPLSPNFRVKRNGGKIKITADKILLSYLNNMVSGGAWAWGSVRPTKPTGDNLKTWSREELVYTAPKWTPLSDISEGETVFVNEDGQPIEFYVAKHNYEPDLNGEGRTLVVRKDCYDQRAWNTNGVNTWASSSILSWLNSDYKNKLDADIQTAIGTTKYYYTVGNGNWTVTTRSDSVFMLSLSEFSLTDEYSNVEGSPLESASVLKTAYYNGNPDVQMTRSPFKSADYQNVWKLFSDGKKGYFSPTYALHCSRPCFTLPSDIQVDSAGNVFTSSRSAYSETSMQVGDTFKVRVKPQYQSYLGEYVEWKIADKNHAGYPSNSVTLITDKIIALLPFDAKEPTNPDSNRKQYGNNRYIHANVRQWLNSSAGAGQWYSAQHEHDAPPITDNVRYNPYDGYPGFLAMLDDAFVAGLLNTSLVLANNTITDGGGSEAFTDKMFLASNTEVGLANENGIVEGAKLAVFSDDPSRLAYLTQSAIDNCDLSQVSDPLKPKVWELRTPNSADSYRNRYVSSTGRLDLGDAYFGTQGIRPLCNIPIEFTVDSDGFFVSAVAPLEIEVEWPESEPFYARQWVYNEKGYYQTMLEGGVAVDVPVSGLRLGDMPLETLISVNEGGSPALFIVAKHDYEPELNGKGRVLFVRKNSPEDRRWNSKNISTYANSEIDAYLNGDYKNNLDAEIKTAIGTTKFKYTPGNRDDTVGDLERSVFLLSLTEVGENETTANVEGSKIPISVSSVLQYGTTGGIWTRSPQTGESGYVWRISRSVGNSNSPALSTWDYWPCFTISADTMLDPNPNPDGSYNIIY